MNLFALLRKLGPNVKYLPLALVILDSVTDLVEAASDGVITGAEKQAVARLAAKDLFRVAGIELSDDVINQAIDVVVMIKNALGAYSKKS